MLEKSSKKVIAIIVARLTSSRLPKKHLRNIAGYPLIYHVIERIKECSLIDKIVIATGPEEENKELADYALSLGVDTFFHDNVNDVTGRIAKAGQYFKADYMVTVSGDCALVDPPFIDEGVKLLTQKGADYLFVDHSKHDCLHEGIGFYTLKTWEKLDELSTTWFHKEHPGSVLKDHLDLFSGVEIIPDKDFQRHDFRMSVDTQADLDFMNEIYSELYPEEGIVNLHDVVALIDKKPWLKKLNGHVHQKGLTEKSKTFLFITHGSKELGMGHLSRCLALSQELQEAHAAKTIFMINSDSVAEKELNEKGLGYQTYKIDDKASIKKKCKRFLGDISVDGVIVDLKEDVLHNNFCFLENIELPRTIVDIWPEQASSDVLSIIPTVQLSEARLRNVPENVLWGPDYLLLGRKILYWKQNNEVEKIGILVASGGSGKPKKELYEALAELSNKYLIKFIIGPYVDPELFESELEERGFLHYQIINDPPDVFKEFKKAEVALTIFGVTAYELISLGIPTIIYDVIKPDDQGIVELLEKEKVCLNEVKRFSDPDEFINKIESLMINSQRQDELSSNGKNYIDGLGGERVAERIITHTRKISTKIG